MSKKITKAEKDAAMAPVIESLLDSIEMEGHLKMMYMVNHRYMKFIRYPKHKKFKKFGECVHAEIHKLMEQVFRLGGTVQYDAGTITSKSPNDSPSYSVVNILNEMLALEEEMVGKFEEYCIQAWEAKDDCCRNLWEHLIKFSHDRTECLTAEVRWAKDLGNKEFAVARI